MKANRIPLALLALALTAFAPGNARAAFLYSHAPVANDPTLTHRATAGYWPHINITEARKLLGKPGILFVDGRTYGEWKQSHIPGAVPLPGFEFDKRFPMLKSRLIHARAVILYCHGFTCGAADYIAQLLAAQGLRNMAVFSGGYPQWKAMGLPLASSQPRRPPKTPAPRGPSADR